VKNPDPERTEPFRRLALLLYLEASQNLAAVIAHIPEAHRGEYAYVVGCQIAEMEAALAEAKEALLTFAAMHCRPQGEA
jgi:hypothetical protein